MDMETIADRKVHEFGVSRAIVCKLTGKVLDKRKAVSVWVSDANGQPDGHFLVTAEAWDKVAEDVKANADKKDLALDILDGRELYARKGK